MVVTPSSPLWPDRDKMVRARDRVKAVWAVREEDKPGLHPLRFGNLVRPGVRMSRPLSPHLKAV